MTFAKKLLQKRIWKRILLERLTEPLHLNLVSLVVRGVGSFRTMVAWDLVLRQHNAYGLLKAADEARKHGVTEITAIEFGVAAGAGLMNMALIAQRVEQETGVHIQIVGFDNGAGMPPPRDYRDHPDLYGTGDFPMDVAKLRSSLPENAELVIGEMEQTVPQWLADKGGKRPIGYVVVDTDYYFSSVQALRVLTGPASTCLPTVVVFLDDILFDEHNSWCGELLAVGEFNQANKFRKIERPSFIQSTRVFKNAPWLKQIYFCHVLDHNRRQVIATKREVAVLENPYF